MMKNVYAYHIKTIGLKAARLSVRATYTINSLKYIKGIPSLNLCTCYRLMPGDLIHPTMHRYTEVVQPFVN